MHPEPTAEWDPELPDHLRSQAANLQASLDDFESQLASRIQSQHVQPLQKAIEEIGEEVDDLEGDLRKAEGLLQAASVSRKAYAEKLAAFESASTARADGLQTALDEGLDAVRRTHEETAQAARRARNEVREGLQQSVSELRQEGQDRTDALSQRLRDQATRLDALDERASSLNGNLQDVAEQTRETARTTTDRFASEEEGRRDLRTHSVRCGPASTSCPKKDVGKTRRERRKCSLSVSRVLGSRRSSTPFGARFTSREQRGSQSSWA